MVVIIRLGDLKIIRKEKIVGDLREAFIDEENLYWMPKNVNLLKRLELEPKEPIQQLAFSTPVLQLIPMEWDTLVVYVEENNKVNAKVIRRSDLTPIEKHPHSAFVARIDTSVPLRRNSSGEFEKKVVHQLGDGLLSFGGTLINQNTGTYRCSVSQFNGSPHFIASPGFGPASSLDHDYTYAWKRRIHLGGVGKISGRGLLYKLSRLGSWDVSRTLPLIATLEAKETRDKELILLSVTAQDLVRAKSFFKSHCRQYLGLQDQLAIQQGYFVWAATKS